MPCGLPSVSADVPAPTTNSYGLVRFFLNQSHISLIFRYRVIVRGRI
jgi:hypothetical protein